MTVQPRGSKRTRLVLPQIMPPNNRQASCSQPAPLPASNAAPPKRPPCPTHPPTHPTPPRPASCCACLPEALHPLLSREAERLGLGRHQHAQRAAGGATSGHRWVHVAGVCPRAPWARQGTNREGWAGAIERVDRHSGAGWCIRAGGALSLPKLPRQWLIALDAALRCRQQAASVVVGELQQVCHSQKRATHPLQSPCARPALGTARASPQPEGPAAWLGPPAAASPAGPHTRCRV